MLLDRMKLRRKRVFLSLRVRFNKNSIFEGSNNIGYKTNVSDTKIGYGTYVGARCELTNSKVGRFCSIGHSIRIIKSDHPTHTFVSTHPCFHNAVHPLMKKLDLSFSDKVLYKKASKGIVIGNDVWIGDDVRIMDGVLIGHGAILGAGSLVTKDVPAFSIVAGVPAKIIRYRFTSDEIELLLKYKWWDLPISQLKTMYNKFSSVKNLSECV